MSYTSTPAYRIETRSNDRKGSYTPMAWNAKVYGRATLANLEKFMNAYNESFQEHGCNYGVSLAVGFIVHHQYGRIVNNRTGRIVCEWNAPLFQEI